MTADLHPSGGAHLGGSSTRRALDELIRGSGASPVTSMDEFGRFHASLWESDEELEAFLADVRASRDAGI